MALGPRVYKEIKANARERKRTRLLLLLPSIASLVFALAVFVWLAIGSEWLGSFDADQAGKSAIFFLVILMVMIPWMILALQRLGGDLRRNRAAFRHLLSTAMTDVSSQPFESAIDAVSIAAGVRRPAVVMINDPSINAISVNRESTGAATVMVTSGSAGLALTAEEKEAMMAHELGHIIAGETMHPPSLWDLEFLTDLFFICATLLAMADAYFYVLISLGLMSQTIWKSAGVWPLVALGILWLCATVVSLSRKYRLLLISATHHADDLFADAVAVSITRDPGSLSGALRKADAYLAEHGRRSVGGGVTVRHLFLAPEPVLRRNQLRAMRTIALAEPDLEPQPKRVSDWRVVEDELGEDDPSLQARLDNLLLIQQGKHRTAAEWLSD